MKILEQFKAEQMTDREFATKYEKIRLELENEKTKIEAEYELKNEKAVAKRDFSWCIFWIIKSVML